LLPSSLLPRSRTRGNRRSIIALVRTRVWTLELKPAPPV
jgi:hypothetical protein